MSWDVILIKEPFDLNAQDESEMANLGVRDHLIYELCKLIPELDYSNKDCGILYGDDFSIEFKTEKKEIVD